MLEHHPWILPTRDIISDRDSTLSYNNQLLYGDWLFDLFDGKTWVCLNFNWPDQSVTIPDDRDLYIFSWHLEPWPYDWLLSFADSHPNQRIIVIGEFEPCFLRANIRILKYHCWHLVLPTMLSIWNADNQFRDVRSKLISCLCGKPDFYRSLIFAFISKYLQNDSRILVSWNTTADYLCPSIGMLNVKLPIERLEDLRLTYIDQNLLDQSITIDSKKNLKHLVPLDRWNFDCWPGAEAWINVTNETYCRSDLRDIGIPTAPGPYLSEKTWIALVAGLAILPNGQPGTYAHLQSMGFRMDWPWPMDFDLETGDLSRLNKVIDMIEWILAQNEQDLISSIRSNCEFNFHHVRSLNFQRQIININDANLDKFLRTST